MDTLPRELLDAVVEQLAVYSFPDSARFPVLDDASRRAILAARLVARCFRDSKMLVDLFVSVMEETPFLWRGDTMPRLVELSRSKTARRMTTLSLCGMSLAPRQQHVILNPGSGRAVMTLVPKDITNVLRRFVRVKHLRYYPISPRCFNEVWPGRKRKDEGTPRARAGYPPDDEGIQSWTYQQIGAPGWICGNTMNNFVDAGLCLESVTFPAFGNRTSYCGIDADPACFPATLKRLTISLSDRFHDTLVVFEPWLKGLRNLTFLEVAIARDPESLGPWNSLANCRRLTDADVSTPADQLPRLEELRLMSDNQNCFRERDLLSGLELFPNLRRLGLAHILIKCQLNNATSWQSFVARLVPKGLERLWLLDPRNLWTDRSMGRAGHYMMEKYWGDGSFRAAAREVRLIDTKSLWVEKLEPPKRRDFDYPGFAIFEQV